MYHFKCILLTVRCFPKVTGWRWARVRGPFQRCLQLYLIQYLFAQYNVRLFWYHLHFWCFNYCFVVQKCLKSLEWTVWCQVILWKCIWSYLSIYPSIDNLGVKCLFLSALNVVYIAHGWWKSLFLWSSWPSSGKCGIHRVTVAHGIKHEMFYVASLKLFGY